MKYIFIILFLSAGQLTAQSKYFTRNGNITFFSKAPLENIEAVNQQVSAILDFASGEAAFQVLMKGFQFKKALMQEHFNESYVESDKYPKATFKGKIKNPSAVNLKQNGVYVVNIAGTLDMHGVSNPVDASGTVEMKDGKMYVKSKFNIKSKDYKIKIPTAVKDNIAESIEVTVYLICNPYK